MATISLTKLEHDFDIRDEIVGYDSASANRTTTAWSWTSAASYQSIFYGFGFKYSGQAPTDGTVTALHFNLTTSIFADDLIATGLSIDLAAFLPLVDGSIVSQDDYYWSLVLGAADRITLGNDTTGNGLSITIAGDGRNWYVGTAHGSNDVIDGDVGTGSAAGDFLTIAAGATVYGGSDKITLTGAFDAVEAQSPFVSGDALTVDGSLIGGNDTVSGIGGVFVFGDAQAVSATGGLRGGNDILTGVNVWGDAGGTDGAVVGGNDTITGTGIGDYLIGDVGAVYNGGSAFGGNDTIRGGGGGDIIYGDFIDVVAGAIVLFGNDTLYGDAGVDEIHGNGGDDKLYGGADADTLYGEDGDDNLWGGAGADQMLGGDGVNLARYDDANWGPLTIRLDGGANSGAAAVGDTYSNIEGLVGGAGNDTVIGDLYANRLYGQNGNDTVDGGAGNDTMTGGLGNDTFVVDSANDKVVEFANEGSDTVNAAVSFTLASSNWVELLQTTSASGSTAIDLTGNNIGQGVIGNNGANKLGGLGGDDLLFGLKGNDTLTGGTGKDSFYFNTQLSSASNVDAITDFNPADDTIKLAKSIFAALSVGTLSSDAFWKSTAGVAHDASDRIVYDTDGGGLFYDADGNLAGGVGAIKFAVVGLNLALTNADFTVS